MDARGTGYRPPKSLAEIVKTKLNPQQKEHSLAQLKHRIEAGEYAVDPGVLAGEILWKVDLVRRVRRQLAEEDSRPEGARTRRPALERRFAPGGRRPPRARQDPRA